MAESPEHLFLKQAFLEILSDFSSLQLFGVTEVQRRTFDLGCNLERDWTRPLVGQVAWNHRGGLDKDMRTLFDEQGVDLRVLVIRGDIRSSLRLTEITKAYERRSYEMFTLKVFPVAADFDADLEHHRDAVRRELRDRVATDIMFNVVFGRLSSDHVRFFALSIARLTSVWHQPRFGPLGTYGTTLAVLHHIATTEFISNKSVGRALDISPSHAREALTVLDGCGFIARWGPSDAQWRTTVRGRVFLELLGRIRVGFDCSEWGDELGYLLRRLDCHPSGHMTTQDDREGKRRLPVFNALLGHILGAEQRWGIDLRQPMTYRYVLPEA